MIRFPISPKLLVSELEGARDILGRWVDLIKNDPNLGFSSEMGGDPARYFLAVLEELRAELLICSGKCEGLADVLLEHLKSE